jgi:radical SAM protein with 4Fe4S-binding SPASM domain
MMAESGAMNNLHVISWNVTRRCNLECTHCYLPAKTRKESPVSSSSKELTTEEAFRLIDQIALVNPEVMLILSGGEPLMREDIFALSSYATGKGMMVVWGSNGLLVDDAVARKVKQSGVSGISISLDSADPSVHDNIRSCKGAWEKAVAAITHCKDAGLSVQINAVVTKKNYDRMPGLIAYSKSLGAKVFSPFFLVCTGRGEELTDISPYQYEKVLSFIVESQGKPDGMMIRTRCAPTVRRILHERNPESPLLKIGTGSCLAGVSYCRISPEGDVTPCPYMPLSTGNVRDRDFGDIWNNSAIFNSLRKPALKGKCKECTFSLICGGCRARAYAVHKDFLEADPWCNHIPRGGNVIKPPTFDKDPNTVPNDATTKPLWTEEAEERLKKVPSFVRSMVRSAVERYAIEHKRSEITPGIMDEVKQKAGMGGMHGH